MESTTNFYDYTVLSLSGKDTLRMSDFKGKFVLCVNVASECGYTPQYEDLEALYQKYKDTLVVIGFPCNQFGGQESGTADEIASFCKKNYGVSFPLSEKIEVKGANQHPIYSWLTTQTKNGLGDYEVAWNFNKFLINPEGKLLKYFPSSVKPMSDELTSLIK
ncbi:MAG: glutathione peroxidase [Bacteroidetes bacterium]|nr:MAG: glutathione peroxidase [Bacteroidota bacterium]